VSLQKRLLPKSARLGGRIGVQTLVSILGSLAVTALLIFLFVGVDSSRTFTVAELWRIGLSISAIAPALICPLIAFRMSKLVRDLRTAHDELADLAGKDTLTGLMNRRGFDAAAVHVFAEARRLGQPIVAIMCDIDMFKDVNDRYGHDVGDIVLIDVAQIIRRAVGARSGDTGPARRRRVRDPAA
jgi:predicted signal transduction protein with EAL and GGDEF domain